MTAQERPPKRPVIPRADDAQGTATASFYAARKVGTQTDLALLVARLAAEFPPIDLSIDEILPPARVVQLLPVGRRGRKAHRSTVFRWYSSGFRGLRLPFLQVGNQRCTSLRALQAFLDALTAIARFERGDPVPACAPPSEPSIDRPTRALKRQLRVEDDLHHRHGL